MSAFDSLFWRLEADPLMRSTASAVTLLERAPEPDVLTDRLRRAAREIPRLRQRVEPGALEIFPPRWVEDPYFDLDFHLRWMRAPHEGSLRSVLDLASTFAMQSFDRTRPLWEFSVVDGLADGRAALIQKMHHSVTDGAAGVMLMQRVYDLSSEGPAETEPRRSTKSRGSTFWEDSLSRVSCAAGMAEEFAQRVIRPWGSIRESARDMASLASLLKPVFKPASPLMRDRSSRYRFETLVAPVDGLKQAAHRAGCKLNDAFLASLAGGWRRYHLHHGHETEALRATMPINARAGEGQAAGNHVNMVRFLVPLEVHDPLERMRRIRKIANARRGEPGLAYMETFFSVATLLPTWLLSGMVGSMQRGVDFVASCVPGVPAPLFVAGAPVRSLFAFGPPAGTACNTTLFSYCSEANVTFNIDPAAVPDPAVLAGCMRKGFDEILACA